MLFWLAEAFDKFLDTVFKVATNVTVFLEWLSHSGDISPSAPSASSKKLLPMLEDDGAAYIEDADFFYDEYCWEGNNNIT